MARSLVLIVSLVMFLGYVGSPARVTSANATSAAGSQGSTDLRKPPPPNPKHALLYVADSANSLVTVYDLSVIGTPQVQQISTGIASPATVALDRNGTLYVGNNGTKSITVYPLGKTAPTLTMSDGSTMPYGIAITNNGTVYAAGRGNPAVIDVYQAGQSSPSQVITDPLISSPSQAIFDAAQNLYVSDFNTGVYEIAAGTNQPVSLNLSGLNGAAGIALDPRLNRLYVSSVNTANTYVEAFKLGQREPLYRMSTVDPDNLAFGGPHFEFLFVPDFFGYEIDVYRPDGRKPFAKLGVTFNSQSVAYKPPHVP